MRCPFSFVRMEIGMVSSFAMQDYRIVILAGICAPARGRGAILLKERRTMMFPHCKGDSRLRAGSSESNSPKDPPPRFRSLVVLLVSAALILFVVLSLMGCSKASEDTDGNASDVLDMLPLEAHDFDAPPVSEATGEMAYDDDDAITEKVASMTLHEKVSQMTITRPEDIAGDMTGFTTEGSSNLASYPFGGICYFGDNLTDESALRSSISDFQQAARQTSSSIPMFITVDEEGGGNTIPNAIKGAGAPSGVTRLARAGFAGTTKLYPMFYYRASGDQVAFDNAVTIASYLRGYGFNFDFAPVADTNSNPDNPVIGYRAYSDDFAQCADLVASAVRGFESENMACSLKHFPGHGDTATDSHLGTASVEKDYQQISSQEMLPFLAGIEAGADSVMMGHILVSSVDDLPASVSRKWVTGVLRDEIGFDGAILTDSLGMGALTNEWGGTEIAVMCVKAGCDIMLLPEDPYAAVDAVVAAVEAGDISESEIDEHVTRILRMKQRHGIWDPAVS